MIREDTCESINHRDSDSRRLNYPCAHQILGSSSKVFVTINTLSAPISYLLDIEHHHAHMQADIPRWNICARVFPANRECSLFVPPLASRKNDSCAANALFTLLGYRFICTRSLEFIEQDAVRNKWKLRGAVRRSFAWTKTRDRARYNLRSSLVN